MNVSSVGVPESLSQLGNVEDKRAQLQMVLLRKVLDSQEQQAAEMVRMMEGKGQVVDIRV